jgi:hypothetical protein
MMQSALQTAANQTVEIGALAPWILSVGVSLLGLWTRSEIKKETQQLHKDLKTEIEHLRVESAAEANKIREQTRAEAQQIRQETKSDADVIRKDFLLELKALRAEFVPSQLSSVQQNAILQQVENVRRELEDFKESVLKRVDSNSVNNHVLSGKMTELLLGPVQHINTALTDKARRMAGFEERERAVSEELREIVDRLEELERHKS